LTTCTGKVVSAGEFTIRSSVGNRKIVGRKFWRSTFKIAPDPVLKQSQWNLNNNSRYTNSTNVRVIFFVCGALGGDSIYRNAIVLSSKVPSWTIQHPVVFYLWQVYFRGNSIIKFNFNKFESDNKLLLSKIQLLRVI